MAAGVVTVIPVAAVKLDAPEMRSMTEAVTVLAATSVVAALAVSTPAADVAPSAARVAATT